MSTKRGPLPSTASPPCKRARSGGSGSAVGGGAPPPSLPPTCKVRNKYLDVLHRHPRDRRIFFDSGVEGEVHDYYVDFAGDGDFGRAGLLSVTGLCKAFFPQFDADKIIPKMMGGATWHPSKRRSKYFGLSPETIKAGWARDGKAARESGTVMHDFIDLYYNGECTLDDVPADDAALKQFAEFTAEMGGDLQPYRSEWFVFTDPRTKVTGAIDMTFVNKPLMEKQWAAVAHGAEPPSTLHLWIYDWKRSKRISKFSRYERPFAPLDKLQSTNYITYSMQLNMYKWILEHHYAGVVWEGHTYERVRVDGMYLCVMHPNQSSHRLHLCPDMHRYVDRVMDLRREALEREGAGLPPPYPFDMTQPPPEAPEPFDFTSV